MLMLDYKDYGWWYWLASTICLWISVSINPAVYYLALAIAVAQFLQFYLAEGKLSAFPVQIRLGYLMFLLATLPDGFQWLLWVPAIGTLARVLTGYCVMARMLVLLPFNRMQSLTMRYVRDAFFTPPVRGNIMHGLPAAQ